jgi:LCP family protein required for cell wall assembly
VPPDFTAKEAEDEASAYVTPEHDPEDEAVGGSAPAPERFSAAGRKELFYTFLIFGKDKGVNTDTIMVGAYDGKARKAYLISIPRDSKVAVKRSAKKINSAYPAGYSHGGGQEGGVAQLRREIKTIIGFTPDYYISVDLAAFVQIVDAVGGVTVDVPIDMNYDDKYQDLYIHFTKGEHVMNGAEALRFARYRKGNGGKNTITDYQRIENQQAVIKAVKDKLLSPGSLTKIPSFVNIFTKNVDTDMKASDALWFAGQVAGKDGAELSAYTIPTAGGSGDPYYYEYLDKGKIVELVNQTINPFNRDIEPGDLNIAGPDS